QIHFTPNMGQFSEPVLFRADFPLGQAVALQDGMVVSALEPEAVAARVAKGFQMEELRILGIYDTDLTYHHKGHAWQLHFLGGSPDMTVSGRELHPDVSHYFQGNDPSKHATEVPNYAEVWYNDVYPGVDVRYYPAEDGSLEYDVICKPGSDPTQVHIEFRGIDRMEINARGELVLHTSIGDVSYPAPYVYQRIDGREVEVPSAYVLEGRNTLRFQLGKYDPRHTLVIDPIAMRWATW